MFTVDSSGMSWQNANEARDKRSWV